MMLRFCVTWPPKVATVSGAVWTVVVDTIFRGPGFFKDVNIIQQLGLDRLQPAR